MLWGNTASGSFPSLENYLPCAGMGGMFVVVTHHSTTPGQGWVSSDLALTSSKRKKKKTGSRGKNKCTPTALTEVRMCSFSKGHQKSSGKAQRIKISLSEGVRHTWYSLGPGHEREGVLFIYLLIHTREGLWDFFCCCFVCFGGFLSIYSATQVLLLQIAVLSENI